MPFFAIKVPSSNSSHNLCHSMYHTTSQRDDVDTVWFTSQAAQSNVAVLDNM